VQHDAIPMISYEDVGRAAGWLSEAFGFRETGVRFADPDGRVTHAELTLGDALVYLGWPGEAYMSPAHHAEVCADARRWSQVPWVVDGVFVTVADVETHHARAAAAGATILRPPEDGPVGRLYSAADLEGHRWMFAQPTS
jgi:uncharacterized glyoxalase superfamily protein PhnB